MLARQYCPVLCLFLTGLIFLHIDKCAAARNGRIEGFLAPARMETRQMHEDVSDGSSISDISSISDGSSCVSNDPDYDIQISIDADTQLYYSVGSVNTTEDGAKDTLAVKMTHSGTYKDGKVWLSLAISESGMMAVPPSDAVVGFPGVENEDGKNPGKYKLTSTFDDGVYLMPKSYQTLMNSSIVYDQEQKLTTMKFTKFLDERGELPIYLNGANNFIWALGKSATVLGDHGSRAGHVQFDFTSCAAEMVEVKDYKAVWIAHSIMGAIAWGVLVPIALSAAWLKDLLPPGPLWFKVHMYCNMLVFVLTVILFIMSVVVFNKKETKHFHLAHHKAGLAIMILLAFQSSWGYFRPPKEEPKQSIGDTKRDASSDEEEHNKDESNAIEISKSTGEDGIESLEAEISAKQNGVTSIKKGGHTKDNIEEKEKLSSFPSIRRVWEVMHRVMGLTLLGLGLYQIDSGLKLFSSHFDSPTFLNVYWGFIGAFAVIVFCLTVLMFRRRSEAAKKNIKN